MSLSKEELKKLKEMNPDINIPDQDLKIDSFNKLLKKSYDDELTIKQVKKVLGIKDADIASMFGYKNAVSYRNSERRNHIEHGIIEIYKLTRIK